MGILAGESIGERGTQLTMRTFHSGGSAMDIRMIRGRLIHGEGVAMDPESAPKILAEVGAGVYERAVAPIHFELLLRQLRSAVQVAGGLTAAAADPARGFLAAASYRSATVLIAAAVGGVWDRLTSPKSVVMSGSRGA